MKQEKRDMTTIHNKSPTKNNDLRDFNFINYKNFNSLNSNSYFINNKKGFGSGTSETVEIVGPREKDRAVASQTRQLFKLSKYKCHLLK